MRVTKSQVVLLLALLAGNAIILYSPFEWAWLRWPVAAALIFGLPGWAWLPVFGWLQTNCGLERLVLIVGASSLLAALVLLVTLLFAPGPFTETPVLIALNLTTLAGLLLQSIALPKSQTSKASVSNHNSQSTIHNSQFTIDNSQHLHGAQAQVFTNLPISPSSIHWPSRTVLLILLLILAVAAVTRLTRLGYGEFHEDELENMRLIVRAYKGEEYAAFLDSKGPIHWLLPAAMWYLNGWLGEGLARLPFALASLLLIPTVYVLGRRLSGGRAVIGLVAAGFVALNGFFVAYARFVENQALIVLWGALGMWLAYRYYREGLNHFLAWLALVLAIGLIAHPDMLLYVPVFGYVIWRAARSSRAAWRRQWLWLAGAGLLFVGLTALFYVPYLTDPNFSDVYQYFGEERIGAELLYNRVDNIFDQDSLYSSRFHAPVLVLLLFWLLGRNFARQGWPGWAMLTGLTLAMMSTLVWPELWQIGQLNLAFAPYALLTLNFILLPQTSFELKALFLWLMVPLGALVFLAKDAADHIQTAYPAWALLSAVALTDLWDCLSQADRTAFFPDRACPFNIPRPVGWLLKSIIALALTIVVSLILFYQYLTFNSLVITYWQAKIDSTNNPDSWYNRVYGSIPRPRKLFANPRLSGWKVVGYLWASGELNGDFRSINESFAVPIWYTFQTPRSCYEDPQHYWLRRDWQGWPKEEAQLGQQGYTLTRIVLVDREPKLRLYEKNRAVAEPQVLNLDDYRASFDRLATPERFARAETISQPAAFNFGDKLLLRGYDLPPQSAQPGDLLPVTVYWQSLAAMDVRYRGFVHLVGPDGSRWGQHDDDPACRLLTTEMRPDQQSSRQFRLPVDPATPPGDYNLVFGLYRPDTLERLQIWDNATGQAVGDNLVLGQVTIQP